MNNRKLKHLYMVTLCLMGITFYACTSEETVKEQPEAQVKEVCYVATIGGDWKTRTMYDDIGVGSVQTAGELGDLIGGQRAAQRVSARALHVGHGIALGRFDHGVVIKGAVEGQHVEGDAEVGKRAVALGVVEADGGLDGVIGHAGDGQRAVSGAQHAAQRGGQRCGSAGKLDAHQCLLGAVDAGIEGDTTLLKGVGVVVGGLLIHGTSRGAYPNVQSSACRIELEHLLLLTCHYGHQTESTGACLEYLANLFHHSNCPYLLGSRSADCVSDNGNGKV